jgi:Flp pilus assembly protein TadB
MVSAVLCGLAVALALPPGGRLPGRDTARSRRRSLGGEPAGQVPLVDDPLRRTLLCVGAAAAACWVAFGSVGLGAGAALGVALSWWLGRMESPRVTREREAIRRDLPLAADLLAACAEAGVPSERALEVVASAVEGPVGARLDGIRLRIAFGADPVLEWRGLARDGEFATLARTMLRSLETGAPLAGGLARLADDSRREQRTYAQLKARKVGVHAAAPLGLCFLPGFMLIGVVPTVAGVFASLLLA